jgi:pimeloyl-ACP methyl ester carboxylesterase
MVKDGAGRVAVVFVHGILSSTAAWSAFERLMAADPGMAAFDCRPFGYSSRLSEWRPDRAIPGLDVVAEGLGTFVAHELAGYPRVVLVGHSQGGLVIQRYLHRMLSEGRGEELARTRLVVLFACPNDGSQFLSLLRNTAGRVIRNPQERALRPLDDGIIEARSTVMNRVVTAARVAPDTCPIPLFAYAGMTDAVVKRSSARSVFREGGVLPGDHFSIIRPESTGALAYTALRDHLLDDLAVRDGDDALHDAGSGGLHAEQRVRTIRRETGLPQPELFPDEPASGRPFRPATGTYVDSPVLAELARLWGLAESCQDNLTVEELAETAGIHPEEVGRWSRGEELPQNAASLSMVGLVLAVWAAEKPQTEQHWSRRLGIDAGQDRSPAGTKEAGTGQAEQVISEITDPWFLENYLDIHAAISPATLSGTSLPFLTKYVPRERDHDGELALVISEAAAGRSQIAVLVGGSSTGKTRACWEAVKALPPGWRLWHPHEPSYKAAVLAGLPGVRPCTVIWLNEIQRYLAPADEGEPIAAKLKALLADESRSPVLVLGTTWPGHWHEMTCPPAPGKADPYPQARGLLGAGIPVPKAFSAPDEVSEARDAAHSDPRWATVLERAEDGEFIQYLAGAPALMHLYTTAEPEAKALLYAAMDARRFGIGPALPWPLLKRAAEGYLTTKEIRLRESSWETVRKRLGQPRHGGAQALGDYVFLEGQPDADHDCCELADYLEHAGRDIRAGEEPPASLWDAACAYAPVQNLRGPAAAAQARGLLRHAALMHRRVVHESGDLHAACQLLSLVSAVDPAGAPAAAEWAASRIVLASLFEDNNYPRTLLGFLKQVHACGAISAANNLACTIAAVDVPPSNMYLLKPMLDAFVDVGANDAIRVLAERITTSVILAQDPGSPALIKELSQAGARDAARLIARHRVSTFSRVWSEPARTYLVEPPGPIQLLQQLCDLGMDEAAEIADELAEHTAMTNPVWARVLEGLRENGFPEAAGKLAERIAYEADLSRPRLAAYLLAELRKAGKEAVLLGFDPATQADLGNLADVARLARELGEAGAADPAMRLVSQVEPSHAAALLEKVTEQGCIPEVLGVVARTAVSCVDPSRSADVHALLGTLTRTDSGDLIRELAAQTSWQVDVSDPAAATRLVRALSQAGEYEAAMGVAKRAAAEASIADAAAVARLIREARKLGLCAEASRLADHAVETNWQRLPALIDLLAAMNEAGAQSARTLLSRRAATGIDPRIGRPEVETDLAGLLTVLHETGQDDAVSVVLRNLLAGEVAPGAHTVRFSLEHSQRLGIDAMLAEVERDALPAVSLADPLVASRLLRELRQAGVPGAARVASRAVHEALVVRQGTAALLSEVRESGDASAVQILTERIHHEGDPGLRELPLLVEELRRLGADQTIDMVVDRAMAFAKRDGLRGHLELLITLAGLRYPRNAIEVLARDAPLFVGFSNPSSYEIEQVHMTLDCVPSAMRELGARAALTEFADRAAGQGYFGWMRERVPEWASKFPYGRTPKGRPEPPWGWDDL